MVNGHLLLQKNQRKSCDDVNCPFPRNTSSLRGHALEGIVVSDKMEKTIIVRRDYLNYVPKFKRYERRRSNVAAHSPPCLEIKTGDKVTLSRMPFNKQDGFVRCHRETGGRIKWQQELSLGLSWQKALSVRNQKFLED